MRLYLFFILLVCAVGMVMGASKDSCRDGKYCSYIYKPICAQRRLRAKVERQTFPNKCVLDIEIGCGEGWKKIKDGEC